MKNEKLGLIDTPIISISEDGLGVSPYVKSLAKLIESCDTPMTISVQGNWGSGKTSFMKLITENLVATNKNYRIVEFNTWQYSKFNLDDILAVSFLDNFANSIIGEGTYEQKTKIKRALKSLTFSTLGVLTNGVVSPSIENILSDDPIFSVADQITELKKHLEEAVDKLVYEKKYERIIIFIDDLDRLHPSKAVDLLEVLQLFLTIKNCVFVLAVDYEVVIQGVKNKMGDQYANGKARNFFDKIVQLPFSIPIGTNVEIQKYVGNLLDSIPDLKIKDKEKNRYINVINKTVQFNPRNLKRVINAYWLLLLVISEKRDSVSGFSQEDIDLALFTILCMQLAYEPLYLYIMKNLGDEEKLTSLFSDFENDGKEVTMIRNSMINNYSIHDEAIWERCIDFISDFQEIFKLDFDKNSDKNSAGFNLLSYVMQLSSSTSTDKVTDYYVEADHISKGKKETRELYRQLNKRVLDLDSSIKVSATKLYISYKLNKSFLNVSIRKGSLKLWLNMKKGELKNVDSFVEDKFIKDVSDIGHWGNGDYEIILKSKNDIEKALPFIIQSYDKMLLK